MSDPKLPNGWNQREEIKRFAPTVDVPADDDLPGGLALAIAIHKGDWPHTTDARVWTDKWLEITANNPAIAHDEGAMIGWFANAIMAGYDAAKAQKVDVPADVLDLTPVGPGRTVNDWQTEQADVEAMCAKLDAAFKAFDDYGLRWTLTDAAAMLRQQAADLAIVLRQRDNTEDKLTQVEAENAELQTIVSKLWTWLTPEQQKLVRANGQTSESPIPSAPASPSRPDTE